MHGPGTTYHAKAPPPHSPRRQDSRASKSRVVIRSRQDFEHRIRVMLRYRWLVLISATLLIIGLSAASFYFLSQPARLRIAVGPAGSDDSRLIQFLGTKFAKDHAPIRLRITATENSAQSAKMLESGFADLAVVRHDLAFPKNGQVVAVLRKNYAVLFAPGEPLERRDPGQNQENKAGAESRRSRTSRENASAWSGVRKPMSNC